MTFGACRLALGNKSESDKYELLRYCGNFNFTIIGGASKLLSFFEKKYKPKNIISYADKRWSNGDIYYKLGFIHVRDTQPNYWYFDRHYKFYHRFGFRKSVLNKKLEYFNPELTEWENMKNNGWNRVWDCGNILFEKKY